MRPRRLLLVIGSLTAGGAEGVVAQLARHWAERGHSVSVLTYSDATDHFLLPSSVDRRSISLIWDTSGPLSWLTGAIRRRNLLRQSARGAAPDFIVSFIDTTNTRVLFSCLGLGIPVLVSERTDPRQHVLPLPWRVLRRLLYPLAAGVVVQTESVAEWARSFVPARRVHIIPNPVRVQPLAISRPAALGIRRSVIAVGRLGREKGFDLLLQAFADSGLPSLDWQLVILGEGSERASLQRQVEELGLQGSVLMPGVIHDPEQWLQHAELFVLPSRFEGFPNALLEAMQCGLAVAAFDCPSGPGEIVQHERTGLLVPPRDIDALSAAISRLAHNPDLRQRLGSAAAIDVAHRFSIDRVSSMWEEFWSSAEAGAQIRRPNRDTGSGGVL